MCVGEGRDEREPIIHCFIILYTLCQFLKLLLLNGKIVLLAVETNSQMPEGSINFRNVWVKYGSMILRVGDFVIF